MTVLGYYFASNFRLTVRGCHFASIFGCPLGWNLASMIESLPSSSELRTALQRRDEFELLCALAGTELSSERIERIANWDLSAVEWSEFLRLAEYHGVLPLAARNLVEHCRGLSPDVERSLRSSYDANLARSLWFAAELARILQHFELRQLRAIPY